MSPQGTIHELWGPDRRSLRGRYEGETSDECLAQFGSPKGAPSELLRTRVSA